MLQAFDHIATQDPNRFLLRYETQEYSYGQMRLEALALARAFQLQGIRPGSVIMMPAKMCPASVACILAAGYGGFSAMLFDSAKTNTQTLELEQILKRSPLRLACTVSEEELLGFAQEMMGSTEALEAFAAKQITCFDEAITALLMPIAAKDNSLNVAPFTWEELAFGGQSYHLFFSEFDDNLYQIFGSLHHMYNIQILCAALGSGAGVLMYEQFDARRLLTDVHHLLPTHIAVSQSELDTLLQEERSCSWHARTASVHSLGKHSKGSLFTQDESLLAHYDAVLVWDGRPGNQLIDEAFACKVNLFEGLYVPEMGGMVAAGAMTSPTIGADTLQFFAGVEARLYDEYGYEGRLALRSTAAAGSYLNAACPVDNQNFFVTQERVRIFPGGLIVCRSEDDAANKTRYFEISGARLYALKSAAETHAVLCLDTVEALAGVSALKLEDSMSFDALAEVFKSLVEPMLNKHFDSPGLAMTELEQPVLGANQPELWCARQLADAALWDAFALKLKKPLFAILAEQVYSRLEGLTVAQDAAQQMMVIARASAVEIPLCVQLSDPRAGKELAWANEVRAAALSGASTILFDIDPKVSGEAFAPHIKRLREHFRDLKLVARCNEGFDVSKPEEFGCLLSWDEAKLDCLVDPRAFTEDEAQKRIEHLDALQVLLKTPICCAKSIASYADFFKALSMPNLACVQFDIQQLGGLSAALDALVAAKLNNKALCFLGQETSQLMLRQSLSFAALGVNAWVELGSLTDDALNPELLVGGKAELTGFGLGAQVVEEKMEELAAKSCVIKRTDLG